MFFTTFFPDLYQYESSLFDYSRLSRTNTSNPFLTFLCDADNDLPKVSNCHSIAPATAEEDLQNVRFFGVAEWVGLVSPASTSSRYLKIRPYQHSPVLTAYILHIHIWNIKLIMTRWCLGILASPKNWWIFFHWNLSANNVEKCRIYTVVLSLSVFFDHIF